MEWHDCLLIPHERTFAHECRLSSLATEWERELAALWRLDADVNNGAYLQFVCNWGRECYVYASQALKKIGALRMAQIVDQCQALIDEHWGDKPLDYDKMLRSLPKKVSRRILDLSYEYMNYPDDIAELGPPHYAKLVADAGWTVPIPSPPLRFVASPEELARAAEADARITDRKCPHCGKPCPSYRKTCKHCRKAVNTA